MAPNWKDSDPDVVREIVRGGEAYLQGQLNLATSADQRAAVLGGVFAASGTAIAAALVTGIASGLSGAATIAAGIVSSLLFLFAGALCIFSVMPVGFWLPGNEPESWFGDVEKKVPLLEALGEEAQNYQEKIEENRETIKTNAKRFKWGVIVGISTPIIGSICWIVLSVCLPLKAG